MKVINKASVVIFLQMTRKIKISFLQQKKQNTFLLKKQQLIKYLFFS